MSGIRGNIEFEYYLAVKQANVRRLRTLIKHQAKPPPNLMVLALVRNHPQLLPILKEAGSNPNDEGFGETALGRAIKHYPIEVVETVLALGADPNKEHLHILPLIWTARDDKINLMRALLKGGADPNHVQWNGLVPLLSAVRQGQVETTKVLLEAGADPTFEGPDGKNAIELAGSLKRDDLVKLLESFVDKSAKTKTPRVKSGTELLLDAIENKNEKAVDKCLASKVDVNARDRRGRSPLDHAIEVGSIEFVEKLITAGAEVNVEIEGVSRLEAALRKERFDIAEVLLKAGAIPKPLGRDSADPFDTVCRMGNVRLAKLFLKAGADPNTATEAGDTPLMCAVRTGSVELVRLLISNRAEIERANKYTGWTALFCAVQNRPMTLIQQRQPSGAVVLSAELQKDAPEDERMIEIARLLLEHGADVNRRDKEGRTPLTFASTPGMARLLIQAGARLDIRDKQGRAVDYWLRKNGIALSLDSGSGRSATNTLRGKSRTRKSVRKRRRR